MEKKQPKLLLVFYGAKGFGPPWNEGLKNTLYSWMKQLIAQGVKVYAVSDISFDEPGWEICYLPKEGKSFRAKIGYLTRLCLLSRKLITDENISLMVFSIFDYSILLPLILLGKTGCPKILAPADRKFIELVEIRGTEICRAPYWLKKFIFSGFKRVICLSYDLRNELQKQKLTDADKIYFLPPRPLDSELLVPDPLPVQGNDLIISHLGSFAPERGIEVVLQAVHLLRNPHIKIHLAWEGTGDGKNIDTLIKKLELGKQVSIWGIVDRQEFLADSQVYIFPMLKRSHVLDYPLSVIEAMLMQQVVVASDFPNYRELIKPGVTGYLYPPGDYRALSNILDMIYLDREKAREIGCRARRFVLDLYGEFNPQKVTEIFLTTEGTERTRK
ncbi:MAG: glycosyltransferase family 4 protein [Candidatus Schekmanbacteria bacterium]|nr:glycosyltransferase family 4 protein [Candidatus Schekmanbacteria bacterium]